MHRVASITAVLWLFSAAAQADQVHLVGGNVIEGKAERHGDKVVVLLESGEVTLPSDSVERIERSESTVQRFEAMSAKLRPGDVKALMALADFCRDHEMRDREQQMLHKVIEASPDHAEARARLGYVRTQSGWITREDQLRAQGLVEHEGQWVTREQLIELERLRAQADTAAHERDKAQAELETKRVELDKARASKAEAAAQPAPMVQQQPAPVFYGGYYAPRAYAPYPAYDADRCLDPPRCTRTAAGPTWPHHSSFPIAGVKDPFDYLHGR
jgi:hypothetical protein